MCLYFVFLVVPTFTLQDSKTSDLLFLIDATGSMRDVIQAAKDKILAVVERSANAPFPTEGWNLRLGFIAYRDFDIKPHFVVQDFTSNAKDFQRALGKVKALSGPKSDRPEDVFGGIEIATMLSWESVSRTIIHIADAPCHGLQYHNGGSGSDKYADGDPRGRDIHAMFGALKTRCKASTRITVGWRFNPRFRCCLQELLCVKQQYVNQAFKFELLLYGLLKVHRLSRLQG